MIPDKCVPANDNVSNQLLSNAPSNGCQGGLLIAVPPAEDGYPPESRNVDLGLVRLSTADGRGVATRRFSALTRDRSLTMPVEKRLNGRMGGMPGGLGAEVKQTNYVGAPMHVDHSDTNYDENQTGCNGGQPTCRLEREDSLPSSPTKKVARFVMDESHPQGDLVNGDSNNNGSGIEMVEHRSSFFPDSELEVEESVLWELVPLADHARNTINPIRRIVDALTVKPNPNKAFIKLHLGDPTITGELSTHPAIMEAVVKSATSGKFNGYGPAFGLLTAREAVAKLAHSPDAPVTPDDVIMTSGCSHALQCAIEALANPGQNILVPVPGFPLYETLMVPHGIKSRHYHLLPEQGWNIDLVEMESLIDDSTAAIILNNPSNPSGAVFGRPHLEAVLRIAERHRVPIIADEIYGDLVYGGAKFLPISTLSPKVPVLTCDGIAKRWLVPGWRLGWVIVNDHQSAFKDVRDGLRKLSTKIIGPCALIQGSLPAIFKNVPPAFFQHIRDVISRNADIVLAELAYCPGLTPIRPYGAMYIMVMLDMAGFSGRFVSELELTQCLIQEESVFCLPGTAFNQRGAVRLVLTYPAAVMREACRRIVAFANRHFDKVLAASSGSINGLDGFGSVAAGARVDGASNGSAEEEPIMESFAKHVERVRYKSAEEPGRTA